ncbi:hypothetical protein AeRB84_013835 [Aphanomyces euteiches]|nr:hypothetical protein AeRB84_013835 [Aphanomyces euteiches]
MVYSTEDVVEMMQILRDRYGNKSFVGHGRLIDEVTHMRMRHNETPRSYCDRFDLAIKDATNAGIKFSDEQVVHFFLNGLDSRFNTFVQLQSHLLQRTPIDASTLSLITTELLQAYNREQSRSSSPPPTPVDEAALSLRCNHRRKPRFNGPSQSDINNETVCAYCNIPNHTEANCRRKQRDQRQQTSSRSNQRRVEFQPSSTTSLASQTAANTLRNARSTVSMLTLGPHYTLNAFESPASSSAWILDSGASDHFFRAANESDMPIGGTGSVLLEMNTPTYNLFSLSRVTDRGFNSQFQRNACYITREEVVYAQGFKHDNLYYLDIANPLPTQSSSTPHVGLSLLTNSATPTQADLWHARLGHISVKYTAKTCQYTDGIELDDCKHAYNESCLAGMQSRLPFPKRSLSTTSEPFALVHSDICGPMRQLALRDRSRYFITFTDDYWRYGFVFFLKNKSDALQCFKEFTAYCRTQFDLPVRCLRSDNGGEYFSTLFSEFLLENGIQHDATVPHTPQQNGVSERMNPTLVECARSLLYCCKAPLRFWAEAVSHAMYLRNRTYSASTPGYRLYTSSPERIIVSRNVVFNETKSFFTEEPSADESPVSQLIEEIDDDDELSLRDETLALPAAPPAPTIVTSAPNEGTPIVPRRSTRIRRGNPRYNVPPVHVPQSTLVEPLPPPTRPIESTPPITEADTSESRVENTPPQPLDDSTTSRVEPAPQQSPSESPADIPLPSSPSHGPMSRTDTPAVTPEFVPVMMPPPTSTDSTSFDEDALCEQFESLALSLFRLRPVANSDVDEHQLRKQHRLLVALALQSTGLPSNIRQAHASPDKHEWIKATDAEYNSLMQHNTWTLCELPPDRKPIGCRWIFTKKYAADGTLSRYKARLVAQGFTQVAGVDYTEVFAPVIQTSSIRFLLALAAMSSMKICHMDVQTAFLNGNLQETLYMKQPPGYVQPGSEHLVCRLNKSIYGLKQSSREWNSALDSYFKSQRFTQLKSDPCIYFRRTPQAFTVTLLSRHLNNPEEEHQHIAKRVLRYLQGTKDYGIRYTKQDSLDYLIELFVYADYANDATTRRSTSGYFLFLNGCLISWKSKLQNIVALSTSEAEYISMSYGLQEALWLKSLLEELELSVKLPIIVYEDNQSTIKMAENSALQQRTKHIDVRHHFIRDLVREHMIKIEYCPTNEMLADMLTKTLPRPKFQEHLSKVMTPLSHYTEEESFN